VKAPRSNEKALFQSPEAKRWSLKGVHKKVLPQIIDRNKVINFISKQRFTETLEFPTRERPEKRERLALKPFNEFPLKRQVSKFQDWT